MATVGEIPCFSPHADARPFCSRLASCCSRCRRQDRPESSSFWKRNNPTLQLLTTPWEYFVTIDQSALWQKHIAWAKPRGSDLKAYISSQYSSRMVLLSLLLATEMSVFFNSSPELINLRQRLSLFNDGHDSNYMGQQQLLRSFLPFWIGFVLLLNICVTISGILATFTTWNVVSAISDSNAHCLLRSSLGQYVTTLSPRLFVASLYMFLLWFLLFVTQLIVGGGNVFFDSENASESIRQFFKRHLHLILLWVCVLFGIVTLFFSIVVPLSAFGRLVLHTGAMGEKNVLSESLQLDLLPHGLHAGLVIRAHHSQRRNTAVTNQYNRSRKRQRRMQPSAHHQLSQNHNNDSCDREHQQSRSNIASPIGLFHGGEGEPSKDDGWGNPKHRIENGNGKVNGNTFYEGVHESEHSNHDGTTSSVIFKGLEPEMELSLETPAVSDSNSGSKHDRVEDCDSFSRHYEELGANRSKARTRATDVGGNLFVFDRPEDDTRERPDFLPRDKPHGRSRRHQRTLTMETTTSLFLPPATILNLSMTANEFNELIDSAMDTSSLCYTNSETPANKTRTTTGREKGENHGNEPDRLATAGNRSERKEKGRGAAGAFESQRFESNRGGASEGEPHATSAEESAGVRASPFPVSTSGTSPRPHRERQQQAFVTRHHRRVSSSRFLLHEWKEEHSVRGTYGAAPPADLPEEIAWETEAAKGRSGPAGGGGSGHRIPSASNRGRSLGDWLLSPFSSPLGNCHGSDRRTGPGSFSHQRRGGAEGGATQGPFSRGLPSEPLLPDLDTDGNGSGDCDEETGGLL